MSDQANSLSWRQVLATALLAFAIASAGAFAACAFWLQDLSAPQVALLGSGNRLSLLVTDGPARLLLATGDDAVGLENALSRVRPVFARRIDVLFLAGNGDSLLAPLAAHADPRVRTSAALAPVPPSPQAEALGALPIFPMPRRVRLGPTVTVTLETTYPFGADPATTEVDWRATIEHGNSRVVALSDGEAAGLFAPGPPASVLAVSGGDPVSAWDFAPADTLVANSAAIAGPELRAAFANSRERPRWGFRVFPGEALRLRFVQGGIEVPSNGANDLSGTPVKESSVPQPSHAAAMVRRRGQLWRGRTHP